jgi:hypothetical protein
MKPSYIVRVRFIGLLLIVASSLCAQIDIANPSEGFAKPLKRKVVDFGPSPFYGASQHVRNKLRCFYYTTFTVKEYDAGEKGAEWLSVAPSLDVPCSKTHGRDEKVYTSEWSGYFRGATGTAVVFDASDAEDGGLPFAVFDVRTGRKLFEDSSPLAYYQKRLHIKNPFHIAYGGEENSLLTYFRVAHAGCDLRMEQLDCWNKVRAKFGIKKTEMPVCIDYERAAGERESAIAYPVSVLLTDSPQIKTEDGPVFCWPTD